MAVIMVAGNQPVIPSSLLSGVRTMTANIVMEMGYATGLHREALIATAVDAVCVHSDHQPGVLPVEEEG